jgi:hypothetical protein
MDVGCTPGATYNCIALDKPMTEAFAKNILELTIRMNGWTSEEVIDLLEKQMNPDNKMYYDEVNVVMRMIGEAITTTANCMDYMSDHSGEKDVEWFKIVRAFLYAGDCEDVAKEAALVASSLRNLYRAKDRLVRNVAQILRRYVIMMVTAMATAPSAGSKEKSSEYICHIYTCAVPRLHVLRMIKEGTKFDDNGERIDIVDLRKNMNNDFEFTKWEQVLPLLILEGTNWCNPLQLPLPLYAPKKHRNTLIKEIVRLERFRASLENNSPTLKKLSVQIQQRNLLAEDVMLIDQENYSGFYRWLIDAWIDRRSYGVRNAIDFSMGHVRRDGVHVYGIDFRDWVMLNKTNKAGEATVFIPTYFLNENDWQSIEYLRDYEYPIPEWTSVPKPELIPELERLKTVCNVPRRTPYSVPYVVYRVNRREKITNKLLGELSAQVNGGAKMEYFLHQFSEDGELYFIEIRIYP